MPGILDIPEVRERVSPLTVEEYERLDEFNEHGRRTELIRGIVIEKMSKSPLHAAIAKLLYDRLNAMVPTGYVVRHEAPLRLADSVPEPDISVVKGAAADFFDRHPTTAELVIEVAISSAQLDRANAQLYAEAGVKEYWIVLGREQRVEIYLLQNREYQQRSVGADDVLESTSVPGLRLRVADIFRQRH